MTSLADNPIKTQEDDTLGRAKAAQAFAGHVLSLDPSEGLVVGVLGPWGSGKTSYINLARGELEKGATVLDFNPWMFSGAHQLLDSFFVELAAQLKGNQDSDYEHLAERLHAYGELLSAASNLPVVGRWASLGGGLLRIWKCLRSERRESVDKRRAEVTNLLNELNKPFVVILDDIDRLSASEVQDIFKLVRLTASFPNVIYLLAFDRDRIEDALQDSHIPGREYLEKIVQVAVDLPATPPNVLRSQLLTEIDDALTGITDPGPFDEKLWPDVLMEVIWPCMRHMRDVRRYVLAVQGTVKALGGQIALVDVLGLEAIRVFMPNVFSRLHASVDALTTISPIHHASNEPTHLKTSIDGLVEAGEDRQEIVRRMIRRLFPAAERHIGNMHYGPETKERWLKSRRVAHEYFLRFYLERFVSHELQAFITAERARELMSDRDALDHYLRTLEPGILEDVISTLEVYEGEYQSDQVVPTTIVLLNLLPDLPKRDLGMLEFGVETTVSRVVLRLLRVLPDPNAIELAVDDILPNISTLSSQLKLIILVGHDENAGHELVPEEKASELEKSWRSKVRKATEADDLEIEREWDLARVLWTANRDAGEDEPELSVPEDPAITLGILKSAHSTARSQAMGNRYVEKSSRLPWKLLVELFGDEDVLEKRIGQLKEANLNGSSDLIALAEKYLRGWRPEEG